MVGSAVSHENGKSIVYPVVEKDIEKQEKIDGPQYS